MEVIWMCITKKEILELNSIIQKINSYSNETERDTYLQSAVEDVDMFISTLKTINKNKLVKSNKKKECVKKCNNYTDEKIIKIFKENDLDNIVSRYSKQELTDMYLTFYSSKPLTSCNKTRIAQSIYHYIYTMNRTKALLGVK